MIKNPDIRSQCVTVNVAKDGIITRTLVIQTNLEPSSPRVNKLVEDAAAYMKAHDDIDRTDIACIVTMG